MPGCPTWQGRWVAYLACFKILVHRHRLLCPGRCALDSFSRRLLYRSRRRPNFGSPIISLEATALPQWERLCTARHRRDASSKTDTCVNVTTQCTCYSCWPEEPTKMDTPAPSRPTPASPP